MFVQHIFQIPIFSHPEKCFLCQLPRIHLLAGKNMLSKIVDILYY